MKTLSAGERSLIRATMLALLDDRINPQDFHHIQSKLSDLLKTNFENRNIWLRFGLTISLAGNSPSQALQAFNECMRIDQDDPLPAMLAAKLSLEHLDDPEKGLTIIEQAITRCNNLIQRRQQKSNEANAKNEQQNPIKRTKSLENVGLAAAAAAAAEAAPGTITTTATTAATSTMGGTTNSLKSPPQHLPNTSPQSSQSSISHTNLQQQQHKHQQLLDKAQRATRSKNCHYKDINQLLSRCYLLASIMHAHIYEREPESTKQFKLDSMQASLKFLDSALESNPNDHLAYFHKALHQVKQRTYPAAIDNLRRAIQLNPHHIPSMQLLILSLSALKFYDEALELCESTLHEHEDNLLLLYIKCNLEQCLVESKGYKVALDTAQHMLKCMRRFRSSIGSGSSSSGSSGVKDNNNNTSKIHSSTTTISAVTQSLQQQQQQQHPPTPSQHQQQQQQQQQQLQNQQSQQNNFHLPQPYQHATSTMGSTRSASINNSTSASITTPVMSSLSKTAGDTKQVGNLFAEDDAISPPKRTEILLGEMSIWLLVAEIFVRVGSVEDAEMCVDEGSTYSSGSLSYQVKYTKGLIAKARNNLTEAKTSFESCLALCRGHAKALQQMAHVHYLQGNYAMAEKLLKDSLETDNDCHETWRYLSLVLVQMDQQDEANECEMRSTMLEESAPVVTFSAIPRLTLQ